MMLVWFILIVVVVVFLYDKQDLFTSTTRFDKILDERLAKGEISLEEYKKLKEAKKNV